MTGWSDTSGTTSLTYDFENRLASYATASTTANYLYDPQGRRLQKTVNSVVTRYLWDGATMIAELDGTNQITRLYTYNPQSMEPVSTAIGCTAYFYITDNLMTPQMLTSMADTTVWYAELSSFGKANVITSTVINSLRFPGQYADAESGLYYNYARYYIPEAGRYAETDPILQPMINISLTMSSMFNNLLLYFSFNPQQLNGYVYVLNNPLMFIDFFGVYFSYPGDIPHGSGAPFQPTTGNPCPFGTEQHFDMWKFSDCMLRHLPHKILLGAGVPCASGAELPIVGNVGACFACASGATESAVNLMWCIHIATSCVPTKCTQ